MENSIAAPATGKVGKRVWLSFILVGLIGQLAWAIENQYINLFVYSQSGDANHINWMTTASAVVATLTTFFVGAFSDRIGKRKPIIAIGYCIWGVTVFLFGLMSLSDMMALSGGDMVKAIVLVGVMNTLVDCVMTFFGSSANDACFSAFVTDHTDSKSRPFVESVISVLPLLAMAMMLLLGMALGLPSSQGDMSQQEFADSVATPWLIFFLICGALTTAVGIASFFLLPKDQIKPNRESNYLVNLVDGFRPKTIKANPMFYVCLLVFLFFNVAVDSFMPYYMVYFQENLGFGGLQFYAAMGVIIGVASIAVIALGAFMERIGKMKFLLPSILAMGVGAVCLYFSANAYFAVFAGTVLMAGYLLGTAAIGARLRDETPADKVGSLQGVRMIMAVMLPMVIGSNLSAFSFQSEYVNEYGQIAAKPDKNMFLVTIGACAIALVAAVALLLLDRKRKAKGIQG